MHLQTVMCGILFFCVSEFFDRDSEETIPPVRALKGWCGQSRLAKTSIQNERTNLNPKITAYSNMMCKDSDCAKKG